MTLRPFPGHVKRLTYRAQVPVSQQTHAAHWRGFTWEAGSAIVSYVGFWGEIQVWASSESEGRRVIGHACAIAGIPTTGEQAGEWIVTEATGGRNGRPGTFQTAQIGGATVVTARDGPNGSPVV